MKLINIIITICILTTPIYGAACAETEEKYPITLSEELIEFTKQTSEEYEIDYRLVLAVMYYESRFTEYIEDRSGTCVGLMQVILKYQGWLSQKTGIELNIKEDSEHNITAGIWMLTDALSKTTDVKYALMIYNRGALGAENYIKAYRDYNRYAKDVYKIYKEYCRRLDK